MMQRKEHTFGEKAKEIFIEILIITFAVTLSIQLHSWSEHRHQQKEAKEFLTDLKADLLKDINAMKEQQAGLRRSDSSFGNYLSACRILKKGEAMPPLEMHLVNRRSNNGYYEGFKSSGKIGYIEHKQIRNDILSYYQDKEPQLKQLEQMNQAITLEAGELIISKHSPAELFADAQLEAKVVFMTQSRSEILNTYDRNINTAQEMIGAIEKELKD